MKDTHIKLEPPHDDERGSLQVLLREPIRSIVRIESLADTRRANHIHSSDVHWCFVEKGKIRYFERPEGSKEPATVQDFGPGQMFYTPAGVEHTMLFLEDTVFFAFSPNWREQEEYEVEIKRLKEPLG